jgi:hypothetical protein
MTLFLLSYPQLLAGISHKKAVGTKIDSGQQLAGMTTRTFPISSCLQVVGRHFFITQNEKTTVHLSLSEQTA